MSEIKRYVLAVIVDNEAGALGRISGLFSGRGYNINSLTVSNIDKEGLFSRVTISTFAPEEKIDHIMALLERLVPVHKVKNLTEERAFIERNLIIIKVKTTQKNRSEILSIAQNYKAEEIDSTGSSIIFQLTDIPEKTEEFYNIMSSYGIIEVTSTGSTAMARGENTF